MTSAVAHLPPSYDVVVPTVGRPSLGRLLEALAAGGPPWPGTVYVVDDSGDRAVVPVPAGLPAPVVVVRTPGRAGPAAARNCGWQRSSAEFVSFLDDDVVPEGAWSRDLCADLEALDARSAAVQGQVVVPRPRRPSDWARNTARLEGARWITADLTVRRAALNEVGGFDERFPRAYREDTDLALRLMDGGWSLAQGRRRTHHPVRPAPWWASVPAQRGNGDDALLTRLHGRAWRRRIGERRGRFRRHAVTTGAAVTALAAASAGRPRSAMAATAIWAGLTAELVWHRLAPGPRTAREVAAMAATSAVIPPAAVTHRLVGWWRHRRAGPWSAPSSSRASTPSTRSETASP
jgi:glycosyltransferase involved in cell wall biosynthesis